MKISIETRSAMRRERVKTGHRTKKTKWCDSLYIYDSSASTHPVIQISHSPALHIYNPHIYINEKEG